jgi:hypothetical protein
MSSIKVKTTSSASEEKMSMYENMVEELVGNGDDDSRFILDGKCWIACLVAKFAFNSSFLKYNISTC